MILFCVTPVAKAQEASYRASLRIAKADKPHTIGEELCLPLAKEITYCVWGEGCQTVKLGAAFKRHLSRRIDNMADDVKNILIERIKRSRYYSIQLDETTDVANLANLLFMSDTNTMVHSMRTFCSVRHWKRELQQSTCFS